MSCKEQQEEEVEVLQSIYEGDDRFTAVNPTTYQYKIGEDGSNKSFVLEVCWGEDYPDELPSINLDCFYNKHLIPEVKESVIQKVCEEADQWLGSAMTYTLFEWVKESAEDLAADQPLAPVTVTEETTATQPGQNEAKGQKVKKEQLSKSQKRKLTNQTNIKGERPRGWNWVDVVKHLSQTGRSKDNASTDSNT